jgi:hypothetical protein
MDLIPIFIAFLGMIFTSWFMQLDIFSILNSQFANTLAVIFVTIVAAGLGNNYTKLAEIRQKEKLRREKSVLVADVLSEWVRSTYLGEFTNEDRWRIQSTYWKSILWLDDELLDLLIPRLANKPDALPVEEILVQTRKFLHGSDKQDIQASQLNNWPPKKQEMIDETELRLMTRLRDRHRNSKK